MGPHKDKALFEKAASSKDLTERADGNRRYASGDFTGWVRSLIESLDFSTVLDVCCGTGNQLVLYGERPSVSLIAGVDISERSVATARERLQKTGVQGSLVLKTAKMEEMFSDPKLANVFFDLISCFYGLYYSRDVKKTLREMMDHVSGKGSLLIVGPYGENNASLFKLLSGYFALPELVVRSSTTFMEEEVYPVLVERFDVRKETFINKIRYPSPEAMIAYWKATTFYSPGFEEKVAKDLKDYFMRAKEFIVEKHIMAYIARKRV